MSSGVRTAFVFSSRTLDDYFRHYIHPLEKANNPHIIYDSTKNLVLPTIANKSFQFI